jgi:hypothetical protein
MRSARLFFFAVCAEYAYNLLPPAQRMLTKHNIWQFLSYPAHTLTICYRMRRVRLQFATASAGYAYNLLPHVQEFVTVCAVYANEAAHMLISPF